MFFKLLIMNNGHSSSLSSLYYRRP